MEVVKELLNKYHFLYFYDIELFFKCNRNISNYSKKEIFNIMKFLESFYYYADIIIFNSVSLDFILDKEDYIMTPNHKMFSLINALINKNLIDLKEIANNEIIDNKQVELKDKAFDIDNRILIIPELADLYEQAISDLMYMNLKHLAFKHILDFKKGNVKLYLKLAKNKSRQEKRELFYAMINSPLSNIEYILQDHIFSDYSFTDYLHGNIWFEIYSNLKQCLA